MTDEQIKALRDEASAAGDKAQVKLCNQALKGSAKARAACIAVKRTTQAAWLDTFTEELEELAHEHQTCPGLKFDFDSTPDELLGRHIEGSIPMVAIRLTGKGFMRQILLFADATFIVKLNFDDRHKFLAEEPKTTTPQSFLDYLMAEKRK